MSNYNPMFMDALYETRAKELGLGDYRPENYYRIIGGEGDTAVNLYRDVQRTGQIRGTPAMGMSSFFSKGLYQPHYGYSYPNNINYLIEATPAFNPDKNPLYKPNSSVTYRPTPKIGGIPFPTELAFPDKGSGSRWITDVRGTPAPVGTYSAATPIENPSFWQRVNPANQYGLKMSTATISSPNVVYTVQPNEFGKHEPITVFDDGAPRWKTKFDYTKPFSQTSLTTHAKNALHIAGTLLEQPEVANIANKANTFANYAGIIPLAASEIEKKRSDYQNPVTQEYFTKDKVVEIDGLTYDSATPQQIAMFHPDNADEHPEITDEMRRKFYPKWFKK